MEIKSVGVVGAGQMGNGIAHVMALSGYDVQLNDVNQEALDKALSVIERNLDRQVSREKITQADKEAAMGRVSTTLEISELGQADLVIEAATEREEVKHKIFESLVPHLKPETILTSNTSSISITRLASRTDRPEKFMGFHFMNPVPVMQLVELIRGIATDEVGQYQTLLLIDDHHVGQLIDQSQIEISIVIDIHHDGTTGRNRGEDLLLEGEVAVTVIQPDLVAAVADPEEEIQVTVTVQVAKLDFLAALISEFLELAKHPVAIVSPDLAGHCRLARLGLPGGDGVARTGLPVGFEQDGFHELFLTRTDQSNF